MDEVYERNFRGLSSALTNANNNICELRKEQQRDQRQIQDLVLRVTDLEKQINQLRADAAPRGSMAS